MNMLATIARYFFSIIILGATVFAQRYVQPMFTITKSANIVFGSNVNYQGAQEDLTTDIYQPQGDTLARRPLIIFVHGGGFVGGDKGTSQFVTLCSEFAKRGYVTASINYRLDSNANARAIMNAMHDARAAVRFFRRNASTYRIDEDRIAMGGGSAGAYTSLCVAYIDKQSELYPGSGAIDVEGNSGNAGYSSKIHACLDYWGALVNTNALESRNDPPLIIIHGTDDNTVLYSNATNLDARATAIGLYHEFYPLQGEGHGPWNQMDSIVNTTTRFLYKVLFNSTTSVEASEVSPSRFELEQNYPNPFSESTTIRFQISDYRLQTSRIQMLEEAQVCDLKSVICLKLYDLFGREVLDLTSSMQSNESVVIHKSQLPNPGVYFYRMQLDEKVAVRKLIFERL